METNFKFLFRYPNKDCKAGRALADADKGIKKKKIKLLYIHTIKSIEIISTVEDSQIMYNNELNIVIVKSDN